jgi:hypothetical protein
MSINLTWNILYEIWLKSVRWESSFSTRKSGNRYQKSSGRYSLCENTWKEFSWLVEYCTHTHTHKHTHTCSHFYGRTDTICRPIYLSSLARGNTATLFIYMAILQHCIYMAILQHSVYTWPYCNTLYINGNTATLCIYMAILQHYVYTWQYCNTLYIHGSTATLCIYMAVLQHSAYTWNYCIILHIHGTTATPCI